MGDRLPFDGLTGCLKGACILRATRIATYRSAGGPVEQASCDLHGGPPYRDLPQAARAREWNAEYERLAGESEKGDAGE